MDQCHNRKRTNCITDNNCKWAPNLASGWGCVPPDVHDSLSVYLDYVGSKEKRGGSGARPRNPPEWMPVETTTKQPLQVAVSTLREFMEILHDYAERDVGCGAFDMNLPKDFIPKLNFIDRNWRTMKDMGKPFAHSLKDYLAGPARGGDIDNGTMQHH